MSVFEQGEKFGFVVSNPPYQDSENNDVPIYHRFFNLSSEVSNKVSMIFLDGWLTTKSKRSRLNSLRSNQTIKTADRIKGAFETFGGADNTTIVVGELGYKLSLIHI